MLQVPKCCWLLGVGDTGPVSAERGVHKMVNMSEIYVPPFVAPIPDRKFRMKSGFISQEKGEER
jgi:hypothetical protein